MKTPELAALAASLFLFPIAPSSHAQAAPAHPAAQVASVEDRRKALNALFHDYWESELKHEPEFASSIGDKRYNDKLSDYSVKAINDWLATEQNFLLQLVAIDPTGLSDQEKTSRDLLIHDLTEDQEAAEFKEWEMPVNQMDGIYSAYPRLVPQLSFTTVKDYDDWIARLHAIPKAFDQVSENMSIGMDDKRVPPKFLLEKTLEQVRQLANQKPEDSPLALPLKKFPASISATEQARIKQETLDAIGKEVLPAYLRFARFLEASYIPAGRAVPGISALPDGAKYYKYLIRHRTTTDLTAEQIHQIGLDEVKKRRSRDAGHRAKARFQGPQELSGQLEKQPETQGLIAASSSRCVPRIHHANAGQAATTLRQAAQGAIRGIGGAGLSGENFGAGLL